MKSEMFRPSGKRQGAFPGLAQLVSLLILCAFFPCQARSASAEPARQPAEIHTAAVLRDFPPLYMIGEGGQPQGFAIDILRQVASQSGFAVRYLVIDNWSQAMDAVRTGRADFVPAFGVTDDLGEEFLLSEIVETVPLSIFVRENNADILAAKDLDGRKVAALMGGGSERTLRRLPKVNLFSTPNLETGLIKLLSGEVDAFVFPAPVLWKKAASIGLDGKIKVVGDPLLDMKRTFLLRQGEEALLGRINRAVKEYTASSGYLEDYQKWYGDPLPFWTPEKILWLVGAPLAAALFLFVAWHILALHRVNQRLRKTVEERRRAEAVLRESEERSRITLMSIGDGVIVTDNGGLVRRVNPVAEGLTGWREEEARGHRLEEVFRIVNEETRRKVESPAEKVLREGTVVGLANHTLLIAKDGRELPIADSGAPIKNDEGETAGVVLVFRDQTEEREYQNRIMESEKRYRALFNSIRDAILVTDTKRTILDCNAAFTDLFGFRHEEIIGRKTQAIYENEGEFQRVGEALRIHAGGDGFFSPVSCRKKDATIFPAEAKIFYLKEDDGTTTGFVALIRDSSEKRKAQRQLTQQLDELRRWQDVTIGRENRVMELKREVNRLLAEAGKAPRYAEKPTTEL